MGGDTARAAACALGVEMAGAFAATDGTFAGVADRFATATSDREAYFAALARGPKSSSGGTAFDVRVASASGQVLMSPPPPRPDGNGRSRPATRLH